MSLPSRIYVGRLAGMSVFDPLGDPVGRVRDAVVTFRTDSIGRPRVIGLVLEVPGRKRVFVPMTRVTSIDTDQVITTGLVNMRRFEQRTSESLAVAELFDRRVTVRSPDGAYAATVEDLAIDLSRKEWVVARVFCRKVAPGSRGLSFSRRRGETHLVDVASVTGLHERGAEQSAERLLEAYDDLKVADLAEVIHGLDPQRRAQVAAALDDDKLADILEELPEDDQVEILAGLDTDRAADILEAMEPDDAADLLGELPAEQQEDLLRRMEPDEAAPLRRLLTYDEDTAGGLMTTEPVILGPEATIAEALAVVRQEQLPTTLATTVFVCRPPLETPTGRYLGLVHIQRLLREPPHAPVGSVIDKVEPLDPTATVDRVHRMLATYDLVAVPVVDEHGHFLGAVTVDDVLDHILPEDWREDRDEVAYG